MSASSYSAATLLAALAAAGVVATEPARPIAIPVVTLVYPAPDGTIFDRLCERRLHATPAPGEVQETIRRRDEFQAIWDREGPGYLEAIIGAVGAPFPYMQMQATLTVCTDVTLAMPLMINTRAFLSGARAPQDLSLFPRLVFHEMMHHYTQPVDALSALQRKYAGEGRHVLSHLHVLAAEQFVLTKLGKSRELALLDRRYAGAPQGDAYRRAWEIVGHEGTAPFIAELRAHLPRAAAAAGART